MTDESPYTISVYVEGVAGGFRYKVGSLDQACSHPGAIVASGYRRVNSRGSLDWYPPHRIYRVSVSGPGLDTQYPDEVFRT